MMTSLGARFGALATALLVGGSLVAATPALAVADAEATIVVTSEANDGPGSLREAFDTANASPETATTITFAPAVRTVTISQVLLSVVPLTIRGNGQDQTEIRLETTGPEWVPALLGFQEAAVELSGLTLTGTGNGNGSAGLIVVGDDGDLAGASSVSDTTIQGFDGAGVTLEGFTNHSFTMTSSTLTGNSIGLDAWGMRESALTVRDSVISDSTEPGLELSYFRPGATGQATIERVQFVGNGELAEDGWGPSAGGIVFSADLDGVPADVSPLRVIDSVFTDNTGRTAGAIEYQPSWAERAADAAPLVLVSGTTFAGNVGGATQDGPYAGASAILIASPPMLRAADPVEESDDERLDLVLRIENSTFDGGTAAAAGMSSALLADGYGNNRVELDQITAVNSTIELVGRGGGDDVTISRSVIDSAWKDPFAFNTEEEVTPALVNVTDSVFTRPSANVDVTAGGSRVLPLAELELGPLADNGGPTPTMLPGLTSPLVDAVTVPGTLTTDQRGLPRPVNGAADIGAVEVQEQPTAVESTVSVVADVKVANGETAVFSVERSAAAGLAEASAGRATGSADAAPLPAVTVKISTADGSAVAGTDYTATEQTLSWDEGETGPQNFAVSTAKREGPLKERTFTVTLSDASEHLTIERATATGTLPAIDAATDVPSVKPPTKGDPNTVAETGGSGPQPWLIAAVLAVLAGAGVLIARRTSRATRS
ncbi:choice-of-anchor Q domain-containing protein [Leucobacter albus]